VESSGTGTGTGSHDHARRVLESIHRLHRRIVESAQAGGEVQLDAYEATLRAIADNQSAFGTFASVEFIKRAIEAQTQYARDMAELFTETITAEGGEEKPGKDQG
jgi:hypothetical protein